MSLYPGSGDAGLMLRYEAERNRMVGICFSYWSLRRAKNVDPLYGEPLSPAAVSPPNAPFDFRDDDPLDMYGIIEFVEYDGKTTSARQEGVQSEYEAVLQLARYEWECANSVDGVYTGARPKEGDVVKVHEFYWDVVKVGRAGPIVNTGQYVGYKLDLRRRSKYVPERKLP